MRRLARFGLRHPWRAALGAAVAAALGAFLVVAAGVVPIKASSRHWPITEWLLHFAMRRAVVTQSLLAPQPPRELDAAAMVARGAAHFDIGCRSCHGAPGDALPPVPHAMTPYPPLLSPRLASWSARQLFYIVKHGVKFTGMPAWPASTRDDEVWAMVSFLRRMPELTPPAYQHLAGIDAAPLPADGDGATELVIARCARCHGRDGGGRGGAFPKLAGQRADYLHRALQAYGEGRRFSGTMQAAAAALTPQDRAVAVRYYNALPAPRASAAASAAAARGAEIAESGIAAQDIPSCNTCHAGDAAVNASYPRLSGQYAWYIASQLELLQTRGRGGSEFVPIMHLVADRLSSSQIRDVAAYYAALTP